MIRFGIFILLVCVGTELSAFSQHETFVQPGAGSAEQNKKKDSDAFKKSLEDCQKLMNDSQAKLETLTQARKDLLEELQKLEKEEADKFMAELEAMEEEWLKKLEEEKESLLKSKDPLEEQWKQWEKLSEATGTVQKEKVEKLDREIEEKFLVPSMKRALGKIDSLLEKGTSESLKEAQQLKEKMDTIYSKGLSNEGQSHLKKDMDRQALGISRAQTGYSILGAVGLGQVGAQTGKYINESLHSIWGQDSQLQTPQPPSSESGALRSENAEKYRQQLNEWRAQQNAGDKTVFNDKMKPLLEQLNNSSDRKLREVPSEIWHDKLPDGSSMSSSAPSKSSTSPATPSSSSDSGQSGSIGPSGGGAPSPQNTLANNAVRNDLESGSTGRGTAPTQPHGAGIQKNTPTTENGDTKKPSTRRSNPDSDIGPILGRIPSGAPGMPVGILAGGTPKNALNPTTAATAGTGSNPGQTLARSTQTDSLKTEKRSFDPKKGIYTSSNAEGLRGLKLDEGLTKNPLSSMNEKIVYKTETPTDSGTSTSSTGGSSNDNSSSNIKAPKSGGYVSLTPSENPENNELRTQWLRLAKLDTGNLDIGKSSAANPTGSPTAALTTEEKNDSKMGNTPAGKPITLYDGVEEQAPKQKAAQKALEASALSIRPITKATPKTTGLAAFTAKTTGITMPSITEGPTTARGLFATKAKPTPKKTGIATAQSTTKNSKRTIASVTPKASTGFVVRGFRELRGLLGAR